MRTYPSTAKAKVASQKLGPLVKKMCATIPSVRPFHSAKRQSLAQQREQRGPPHTVQAERNEEQYTNNKRCIYMGVAPRVGTTRPVERQKHQCRADNEQGGADGVACPRPFLERHPWVFCSFLGPVECKDTHRGEAVESGLDPEDVAPARWTSTSYGTCSQSTNTTDLSGLNLAVSRNLYLQAAQRTTKVRKTIR